MSSQKIIADTVGKLQSRTRRSRACCMRCPATLQSCNPHPCGRGPTCQVREPSGSVKEDSSHGLLERNQARSLPRKRRAEHLSMHNMCRVRCIALRVPVSTYAEHLLHRGTEFMECVDFTRLRWPSQTWVFEGSLSITSSIPFAGSGTTGRFPRALGTSEQRRTGHL